MWNDSLHFNQYVRALVFCLMCEYCLIHLFPNYEDVIPLTHSPHQVRRRWFDPYQGGSFVTCSPSGRTLGLPNPERYLASSPEVISGLGVVLAILPYLGNVQLKYCRLTYIDPNPVKGIKGFTLPLIPSKLSDYVVHSLEYRITSMMSNLSHLIGEFISLCKEII